MQQISLIDETFNIHNSNHYKLTIQCIKDGFSYVVFDTIRKKFIVLKHFYFKNNQHQQEELPSVFEKEDILKAPFENIKVYVFTDRATIIPKAFSSKEKTEQFINFNFGENSSARFRQCLAPFDTILAFSLPVDICNLLDSIQCHTFFPHAVSVLNEAYKNKHLKENFTGLFIHIVSDFAQVVVVKSGNLLFFNIFPFKTSDDLCYFLLYLYESFDLDKEKDTISVSGIIQKNDEKIKALERFFKNINFSKVDSHFIYSYRFNEIPQHHFSNLFIPEYENYQR